MLRTEEVQVRFVHQHLTNKVQLLHHNLIAHRNNVMKDDS